MERVRQPFSNEDGDVRPLTDAELVWGVETADFPAETEVYAFLIRRSKILADAESEGFDRNLFLAFEPNKPGFEDRATAAIAAFKAAGRIAAE